MAKEYKKISFNEYQIKLINLFKKINIEFDKQNIKFKLFGATLAAAHFDKKIFKWDDDIDLYIETDIFLKNRKQINNILKNNDMNIRKPYQGNNFSKKYFFRKHNPLIRFQSDEVFHIIDKEKNVNTIRPIFIDVVLANRETTYEKALEQSTNKKNKMICNVCYSGFYKRKTPFSKYIWFIRQAFTTLLCNRFLISFKNKRIYSKNKKDGNWLYFLTFDCDLQKPISNKENTTLEFEGMNFETPSLYLESLKARYGNELSNSHLDAENKPKQPVHIQYDSERSINKW